jgi:hypothetical protein
VILYKERLALAKSFDEACSLKLHTFELGSNFICARLHDDAENCDFVSPEALIIILYRINHRKTDIGEHNASFQHENVVDSLLCILPTNLGVARTFK